MRSIRIVSRNEAAPSPMGNPFFVANMKDLTFSKGTVCVIDVGIDLEISDDMFLEGESLVAGLVVLKVEKVRENGLVVVAVGLEDGVVKRWEMVAKVSIVKRELEFVRFVEMVSGGRMVFGGAKEVREDLDESKGEDK